MLKLVLQFVISGTVVVAAGLLAAKVGQKWAGLLVAAPLFTLITFVLLSLEPSQGSLKEYLIAALIYMIPAAIFIASLLLVVNRMHFVAALIVAALVYAVSILLIQQIVKL